MVFSFHFLENSTREINKNHALCSFISVQHLRKIRRKSHEQFLRSVPFWENCTIKSTKTSKIRKCDHFGYFGNFEVFAAHEFHAINCYGRFGGAKNHPKDPLRGFRASGVPLGIDSVRFVSRKHWQITKIAETNKNGADALPKSRFSKTTHCAFWQFRGVCASQIPRNQFLRTLWRC